MFLSLCIIEVQNQGLNLLFISFQKPQSMSEVSGMVPHPFPPPSTDLPRFSDTQYLGKSHGPGPPGAWFGSSGLSRDVQSQEYSSSQGHYPSLPHHPGIMPQIPTHDSNDMEPKAAFVDPNIANFLPFIPGMEQIAHPKYNPSQLKYENTNIQPTIDAKVQQPSCDSVPVPTKKRSKPKKKKNKDITPENELRLTQDKPISMVSEGRDSQQFSATNLLSQYSLSDIQRKDFHSLPIEDPIFGNDPYAFPGMEAPHNPPMEMPPNFYGYGNMPPGNLQPPEMFEKPIENAGTKKKKGTSKPKVPKPVNSENAKKKKSKKKDKDSNPVNSAKQSFDTSAMGESTLMDLIGSTVDQIMQKHRNELKQFSDKDNKEVLLPPSKPSINQSVSSGSLLTSSSVSVNNTTSVAQHVVDPSQSNVCTDWSKPCCSDCERLGILYSPMCKNRPRINIPPELLNFSSSVDSVFQDRLLPGNNLYRQLQKDSEGKISYSDKNLSSVPVSNPSHLSQTYSQSHSQNHHISQGSYNPSVSGKVEMASDSQMQLNPITTIPNAAVPVTTSAIQTELGKPTLAGSSIEPSIAQLAARNKPTHHGYVQSDINQMSQKTINSDEDLYSLFQKSSSQNVPDAIHTKQPSMVVVSEGIAKTFEHNTPHNQSITTTKTEGSTMPYGHTASHHQPALWPDLRGILSTSSLTQYPQYPSSFPSYHPEFPENDLGSLLSGQPSSQAVTQTTASSTLALVSNMSHGRDITSSQTASDLVLPLTLDQNQAVKQFGLPQASTPVSQTRTVMTGLPQMTSSEVPSSLPYHEHRRHYLTSNIQKGATHTHDQTQCTITSTSQALSVSSSLSGSSVQSTHCSSQSLSISSDAKGTSKDQILPAARQGTSSSAMASPYYPSMEQQFQSGRMNTTSMPLVSPAYPLSCISSSSSPPQDALTRSHDFPSPYGISLTAVTNVTQVQTAPISSISTSHDLSEAQSESLSVNSSLPLPAQVQPTHPIAPTIITSSESSRQPVSSLSSLSEFLGIPTSFSKSSLGTKPNATPLLNTNSSQSQSPSISLPSHSIPPPNSTITASSATNPGKTSAAVRNMTIENMPTANSVPSSQNIPLFSVPDFPLTSAAERALNAVSAADTNIPELDWITQHVNSLKNVLTEEEELIERLKTNAKLDMPRCTCRGPDCKYSMYIFLPIFFFFSIRSSIS